MAEGVVVLDTQGCVRVWNHAMTDMTGYTREEALGRPASWLASPSCKGYEMISQLLRGELDPYHSCISGCECQLTAKNGETIPVLINARVLEAEDGTLLGLLQTATDFRSIVSLRKELLALESKLRPEDEFHGLIGHSAPMRNVQRQIMLAAESESSVLILGQSGTGKELAASAIHALSARAKGPFVKVNCGALTETLLESELFGHVKGAYTGAYRDRHGRFESADGGTIFLDEIGEISQAMQVKLLRVLQEGEFERVGETRTLSVDVRVIAATNRELFAEMQAGRFRDDLYYRLRVFPMTMPPLAGRSEDIPQLVQHFINRFTAQTGKLVRGISGEAMKALIAYCWPGNVRELENAIEYAFVVCQTEHIKLEDLPDEIRYPSVRAEICEARGARVLPAARQHVARDTVTDPERLKALLEACGWNKAEVARRLGLSRTAVWKWMKKHGIPLKK
jgi:PAS domain S-box-containing protein